MSKIAETQPGRIVMPPQGMLREQDFSLLRCVELFEGGAENIYLVDDEGRYRWRAAVKGKARFQRTEQGNWVLKLQPVPPIVFDKPVVEENLAELQQLGDFMFSRNPGVNELPVTTGGGVLVCAARTRHSETKLDWSHFSGIPSEMPKGEIYISSLKNPLLADFYRVWHTRLQLKELTQENLEKAMFGGDGHVLLYGADVYPESCPGMNVLELHRKLWNAYVRYRGAHWWKIGWDYACIRERDLEDLSLLAGMFDRGYFAVHVVDEIGLYRGTLSRHDFNAAFPQAGCMKLRHLAYPYTGNSDTDRNRLAEAMEGTSDREAALLQDGHIAAVGWLHIGSGLNLKDFLDKQPALWELVSDEVICEFFGERRRVLLSSDEGDLGSFYRRFRGMLDIAVYTSDMQANDAVSTRQVFLYGSAAWHGVHVKQYPIRFLYGALLAETLRRYFLAHGIDYYCGNNAVKVENMEDRVTAASPHKLVPPVTFQGIQENYMAPSDCQDENHFLVIGGHRQDAEPVEDYTRTVFIYGPCTALGQFASDGHTIEAVLQQMLIARGRRWRVVNCGSLGTVENSAINSLHYMLNTRMREGDVVIQLDAWLWQKNYVFDLGDHYFDNRDVFDDEAHRHGVYFWDAIRPQHITDEGHKVWAEFLLKKLLTDAGPASEDRRGALVPPLSMQLGASRVRNKELARYLGYISIYRRYAHGAIVMNANPFTLGHLYLVEEARKQCDCLYVFVVEEDQSEIPFQDRLAMVKAGCAGFSDVQVLPSGRYMVSALTFPEYFQKEEAPSQTVMPSQDLQLFGDAIAPTLGITKRFVGEEPFDNVTRQYNEAMKSILPDYGVEVVEIPRKCTDTGETINAKQVRKWMKAGAWERCKAYLPETTLSYLRERGALC